MTEKQQGWQPIETAPRDGTIVDLWVVFEFPYKNNPSQYSGKRVPNCRWRDESRSGLNRAGWIMNDLGLYTDETLFFRDGDVMEIQTPTYWMPLPPPPEGAE